jgi:acetoacetyl-CoA synthetase
MYPNSGFSDDLEQRIRKRIRDQLSPRHVPAIILPIADIPYTHTGKKVEVAVKKVINGNVKVSREALRNPESIDLYASFLSKFPPN